MEKVYCDADITWSSIEKYYQYGKVIWSISKEGIPRYKLVDKDSNIIDINFKDCLEHID